MWQLRIRQVVVHLDLASLSGQLRARAQIAMRAQKRSTRPDRAVKVYGWNCNSARPTRSRASRTTVMTPSARLPWFFPNRRPREPNVSSAKCASHGKHAAAFGFARCRLSDGPRFPVGWSVTVASTLSDPTTRSRAPKHASGNRTHPSSPSARTAQGYGRVLDRSGTAHTHAQATQSPSSVGSVRS